MEKEIKTVSVETAKLEVKYCIPDWLRDQQIRMSIKRFPNRFSPVSETRSDPIAVICFGPSLNDTWESIKQFKFVMSCSGSHKYLVEKGIIPNWHCEVDPRQHKIKLLGEDIRQETNFLMASCCHPLVFDHLEMHNAQITLWHTYSGESESKLPEVFPRGDWVVTGGANVGLRAMVLARMLGFLDIHIFGMDGSFPENGNKHAADHPNQAKGHILAEFKGRKFATTTAFLECARMTFHEIAMLPDTKFTFYGDGLIQYMAQKKIGENGDVKRKKKAKIAFLSLQTISAPYIQQNKILHTTNPQYGTMAVNYVKTVLDLFDKTSCRSILDYGCGKGLLAKNIPFPIWEYDPAIEGKDWPPRPSDLVVALDVLEHVEPEYLDSTLADIARCTKKVGYFVINTIPSSKVLPDGRNTHLIQKGRDWWYSKLSKHFVIPKDGMMQRKNLLHVVVGPKVESRQVKTEGTSKHS